LKPPCALGRRHSRRCNNGERQPWERLRTL
jgi:hypothetical protein